MHSTQVAHSGGPAEVRVYRLMENKSCRLDPLLLWIHRIAARM